MKCKIYVINVTELNNEEVFDYWMSRMPQKRRDKIDRIKPLPEKCRSLGAGILFLHAMKELNVDHELLETANGENGKPYLVNAPGIYFNMAHSGDYAALAIADEEVGIDIEAYGSPSRMKQVIKRVLSSKERDYIDKKYGLTADDSDLNCMFYRIWSMKESIIKCIGTGLATDLREVEIELWREDMGVHDCSAGGQSFLAKEYEDVTGYAISVCFRSNTNVVFPEKISQLTPSGIEEI